MAEFKAGDRVQVVNYLGSFDSYTGEQGTIWSDEGDEGYKVRLDNFLPSKFFFFSEELEKVND